MKATIENISRKQFEEKLTAEFGQFKTYVFERMAGNIYTYKVNRTDVATWCKRTGRLS